MLGLMGPLGQGLAAGCRQWPLGAEYAVGRNGAWNVFVS